LKKDEEIKNLLHREDGGAVEAKPDLSSPIKSDKLASNGESYLHFSIIYIPEHIL
jgi:hypothetical protein